MLSNRTELFVVENDNKNNDQGLAFLDLLSRKGRIFHNLLFKFKSNEDTTYTT